MDELIDALNLITGDACKRHPREYEGEIQSECDQLIKFETLLKRGD